MLPPLVAALARAEMTSVMQSPDGADVIAVVVVTYNSAHLLPDLIGSLDAGLNPLVWHLTVVDNASSDRSLAVVRELAPDAAAVQTGRNAGYAAGINAGLAAARPFTAALVLNPDVRLMPGCVAELLIALRQPGTGIAVPRLVDRNGELITTLRREPTVLRALGDAFMGANRAGRFPLLGEVVTDRRRYKIDGTADWAEGSTMLVSAECLRICGTWDESFFLYSEETDFALRARDRGLVTRYTPGARAVHLEGDSRESPGLWSLLVLNRVMLFRRRNGTAHATFYWAALLLREASRAALGKRTSRTAARSLISPARLRHRRGPQSLSV